jgi:hypothetical protein
VQRVPAEASRPPGSSTGAYARSTTPTSSGPASPAGPGRGLAEAAGNADPADARKALADVEAAAMRWPAPCGVDVDQVGG